MAGCMKFGVSVIAILFLFFGWQSFWNNDSSNGNELVSLEEPASAKPTPEFGPLPTRPETRPVFSDPEAQSPVFPPQIDKKPDLLPPSKEYTASQTTQISVPKKLLPVD